MSNLTPSNRGAAASGRALSIPDRRTARDLAIVERQTVTRMARVRSDAIVQSEKVHEVDHLVREAMTGQAMLTRWSQTLAQGDPFVNDDLKFFTDLAKMAKGEIIAETADSFSRENRR